jgi:hypothetical protein
MISFISLERKRNDLSFKNNKWFDIKLGKCMWEKGLIDYGRMQWQRIFVEIV